MYSESAPDHLGNNKGGVVVDWSVLVASIVHPLKVQIVEAIGWIGEPMSAVKLEQVFDKTVGLANISYHVESLEKLGVLKLVRTQPVRGATEHFYYFTPHSTNGS